MTRANVVPGEIITLRIAIWDTSDHVLDSLAVFDAFQWSIETAAAPYEVPMTRPDVGSVASTAPSPGSPIFAGGHAMARSPSIGIVRTRRPNRPTSSQPVLQAP